MLQIKIKSDKAPEEKKYEFTIPGQYTILYNSIALESKLVNKNIKFPFGVSILYLFGEK